MKYRQRIRYTEEQKALIRLDAYADDTLGAASATGAGSAA